MWKLVEEFHIHELLKVQFSGFSVFTKKLLDICEYLSLENDMYDTSTLQVLILQSQKWISKIYVSFHNKCEYKTAG